MVKYSHEVRRSYPRIGFPVSTAFAVALTDPLDLEPKYANSRYSRPIVFASGDSEDGAVHSMSAKFEMHNRPGTRYGIDFADMERVVRPRLLFPTRR